MFNRSQHNPTENTSRELLPEISASTETDVANLIADSHPEFPLSRVNAIRAVTGPQGAIREVAGPEAEGPDVVLKGPGGKRLRREVKSIAGRAQGSCNKALAHASSQIGYQGEILIQMPRGTNALRHVLRFRGSRMSPAELGVYRSVSIIIVDDMGMVLY